MHAVSASHKRAANSVSVVSTVCRSKVERLMTLSTSAVAVCCCRDSRSSLSSRTFSIAMTAWLGEVTDKFDLLVGERADFFAIDDDGTDQLVLLEHRDSGERASTSDVNEVDDRRIAFEVGPLGLKIGDVHGLFGTHRPSERTVRVDMTKYLAPYLVGEGGPGGVYGNVTEGVSLPQHEIAKLGVADSRGLLQHGLEHRRELAR